MTTDLNTINEAVARLHHLTDILVDDMMDIDRGVNAGLDVRLDRLDSLARVARDLAKSTLEQIEANFKAIGTTCSSVPSAAPAPCFTGKARAFALAGQMEEPIATISDFSRSLCFLSETFDEAEGKVIQRLGSLIMDECEKVEARRGELFSLTHPSQGG